MKAITVLFSTALIGFAANAAEPTTTTTTGGMTPKQVCENLAKAATANDFKAFSEWTAMGPMKTMHHGKGMHAMPSATAFEKMHKDQMAKLKTLGCIEEKIAGDHAFVEATSNSETRLVPFVKEDGKWKFDMHTYRAFYHPTTGTTTTQK